MQKGFADHPYMDGVTYSLGSGRKTEKRQEAYCYGH